MGWRALKGRLAVPAAALATALVLSASASSQGVEGVKFIGRLPTAGAIGVRSWTVEAESDSSEGVSLSSLTPSVCTLTEERPLADEQRRFASGELSFIAVGTCTVLARAGTAEAERSLPVYERWSKPVGNTPKIMWGPPAEAVVGREGTIELGARAHAGARLSSATPSICALTPIAAEAPAEAAATVRFEAAGTCTIVLVVAGGDETKTEEEQKSFPVLQRPALPGEGVPASVRPTLLKVALEWAAKRGDPHPYDIQAVRTLAATPRFVIPKHPEKKLVYLVAMRGRFRPRCRQPKEGPRRYCIQPVAEVFVLASTIEALFITEPSRYPNLKSRGVPVRLKEESRGEEEAHMRKVEAQDEAEREKLERDAETERREVEEGRRPF